MRSLPTCLIVLSILASVDARAIADPSPAAVDARLAQWERASAAFVPREARKSPLGPENGSAHEQEVLALVSGPVTQPELLRRFHWTLSAETESEIVLHAVPRDAVETLFYRSVTITLSKHPFEPQSVQFHPSQADSPRNAVAVAPRRRVTAMRPPGAVRRVAYHQDQDQDVDEPSAAGILRRWEAATHVRTADIRFRRFERDTAVGVERRGEGRFLFESPNRGLYSLHPSAIPAQDRAARPVAPSDSYTWYWTGRDLIILDEEARTQERLPLPDAAESEIPAGGSWDVVWAGLSSPQNAFPCVIAIDADDMEARFRWSVLDSQADRIVLQARPITEADRHRISEMQVVLDPQTYRTRATKIIAAGGDSETVHVLHSTQVNVNGLRLDAAPWMPDLSRYQRLTTMPPVPPVSGE